MIGVALRLALPLLARAECSYDLNGVGYGDTCSNGNFQGSGWYHPPAANNNYYYQQQMLMRQRMLQQQLEQGQMQQQQLLQEEQQQREARERRQQEEAARQAMKRTHPQAGPQRTPDPDSGMKMGR